MLPESDSLAFWLIATAMTALALAFVLPRLRTRREPNGGDRGAPLNTALNAAIYRADLAELAREHAESRLTDAEYASAREDLERRLLSDVAEAPGDSAPSVPPRGIAIGAAVALPALAFGLYAHFGDPMAIEGSQPSASAAFSSTAGGRAALVRHLARNPGDGRGWVLLARADFDAERFGDAAASFAKALAATPKIAADPGIWCEYADALGMAQGGTLTGQPREHVLRALALDPAHPKALEMAGSAAYEQREFTTAAKHWRQLLAQLPDGSRQQRELAAAIDRAERLTFMAERRPESPQ